MPEKIKKILWSAATSGLKDVISLLKIFGFNTLANKLEQKRGQYIEAQVINEDLPEVKGVKWLVYIVIIISLIFTGLKIKGLIKNR